MEVRIVLAIAALALAVGVTTASAGHGDGGGKGNTLAAACKKGGWKTLYRYGHLPRRFRTAAGHAGGTDR